MIKNKSIIITAIALAAIIIIPIIIISLNHLTENNITYKSLPSPDNNKFDVIVFGGEPEGISAAVSAARSDLDVLLITEDSEVGGLMTLGRLNFIDMNYDSQGTLLTRGIFEEFYDKVGGSAFEIDRAVRVFRKMLKEENVNLKKEVTLEDVIMENNNLTGISVKGLSDAKKSFKAKKIIDASADADLAVKAGVPYILAGEDINQDDRPMGVTLIFEVENINWPKLFLNLNFNRILGEINQDYRRAWGAKLNTAWGYDDKGHAYEPSYPNIVVRGLNIARQEDNKSLINCLLVLDVDPLSEESRAKARKKAETELEDLIPYFKENLPGFENIELVDTAEKLYTRESRYIKGEYQLDINDVLGNRDHYDRIAIGSYPVDIQPTKRWQRGVVLGNPDRYSVPFRSIVPQKVDNLLVVGRSAAFTSLSGGSARVIPIGMNTAEAAGVAAKYSIEHQASFREIAYDNDKITSIQKELISRGAYLEAFEREDPLKNHLVYESIKTLRKLGVIYGGYDNDYDLDEKISRGRFRSILNAIIKDTREEMTDEIIIPEDEDMVADLIFNKILKTLDIETSSFMESKELLIEKEILTMDYINKFEKNEVPKFKDASILLANLYNCLKDNNKR